MTNPAFEDAFNLLCGAKLGEGVHRDVFECRLRPELVVKVEKDEVFRNFMNVAEMRFWDYAGPATRLWLAPCHYLSPDGRVLLQSRCDHVRKEELPEKLPSFLTDIKAANFGIYEGRLVAVDYALHYTLASMRLQKVTWA